MIININNNYGGGDNNNNSGSYNNLDPYFLNCYFLKFFYMIRFFFLQFQPLIFNFFRIELHDFSRLGASSLMTRVTNLKKLIYFFKKALQFFLFLIELFQLYNLDHGFDGMSHVDLTLISVFTYLS
jgi:hypothetical protein